MAVWVCGGTEMATAASAGLRMSAAVLKVAVTLVELVTSVMVSASAGKVTWTDVDRVSHPETPTRLTPTPASLLLWRRLLLLQWPLEWQLLLQLALLLALLPALSDQVESLAKPLKYTALRLPS